MRKFTTLFLLALAMTIGASQAFAQSNTGASNDNGKAERSSPERDDNGDDPINPRILRELRAVSTVDIIRVPCVARPCFPPPRKPKLVKKETEGSGCEHKVMRVNGRFMPFIDCYKLVEVDGRMQLRYSRK